MFFEDSVKSMDVPQAKEMISKGDVVIIDIRASEAYHAGHVNGAVFVDRNDCDEFIEQTECSEKILCYCYKGVGSKSFCQKLKQLGFKNVYSLEGGFEAWKKHD